MSAVDKTKSAAQLIAEKMAKGEAARTKEEISANKPLVGRYDRGDSVSQQKLQRNLMALGPDEDDEKILVRVRAEQLTSEQAKKVAADADERRDRIEGPLKKYDAAYLHQVPVYEKDAAGKMAIVMVEDPADSSKKIPSVQNLFNPALTRLISLENCKRWQADVNQYGSDEDLVTERWATSFIEQATEEELLREVRREMRDLPTEEQGSIVLFKMISDSITSHHEEQVKVVVKIVKTLKPSDVKGEHIPTFLQDLNVAVEYLIGADSSKGEKYIPYDFIECLLKNLSEGCRQAEFADTFSTLYKNWKNAGTPTNLDGKEWREQYKLIRGIALSKYNDLSITDADGKNEWTGANSPGKDAAFKGAEGLICWRCGEADHFVKDCKKPKSDGLPYRPKKGKGKGSGAGGGRSSNSNRKSRSQYPPSGERRRPEKGEERSGRMMVNKATGEKERHWPCSTCKAECGDAWSTHEPGKKSHEAWAANKAEDAAVAEAVKSSKAAAAAAAAAAAKVPDITAAVQQSIQQALPRALESLIKEGEREMAESGEGSDRSEGAQYFTRALFHGIKRSSKD